MGTRGHLPGFSAAQRGPGAPVAAGRSVPCLLPTPRPDRAAGPGRRLRRCRRGPTQPRAVRRRPAGRRGRRGQRGPARVDRAVHQTRPAVRHLGRLGVRGDPVRCLRRRDRLPPPLADPRGGHGARADLPGDDAALHGVGRGPDERGHQRGHLRRPRVAGPGPGRLPPAAGHRCRRRPRRRGAPRGPTGASGTPEPPARPGQCPGPALPRRHQGPARRRGPGAGRRCVGADPRLPGRRADPSRISRQRARPGRGGVQRPSTDREHCSRHGRTTRRGLCADLRCRADPAAQRPPALRCDRGGRARRHPAAGLGGHGHRRRRRVRPGREARGLRAPQQVRVSLDRIGAVAAVEAAPGAGTIVRLTGP